VHVLDVGEVWGVGLTQSVASRFWISALFLILMTTCSLISSSQFLAMMACSRARIWGRVSWGT